MRAGFLASLLLLPLPVLAQDTPAPQVVEVRLSSFAFAPRDLVLPAGRPVVLRLVNGAGGGHNFSAPAFVAAATGVSGPVEDGEVEVPGRQSVEVRLTPAPGSYRLRCTHTMHTAFGMRGTITVR